MRVEGDHYSQVDDKNNNNKIGEVDLAKRVRAFVDSFPSLQERHVNVPLVLSLFERPQDSADFDWQNDHPPKIPLERTFVYEAHVRALSSQKTFQSAVSIIPYLKWLGVTALELMPIFEFCETEINASNSYYPFLNKPAAERRGNQWGYMPCHFFQPNNRYSHSSSSAACELKTLVKALHSAGIECILDVVYNHTSHASCPVHFFGMSEQYFMRNPARRRFSHYNISGCGNTLSPNSPATMNIILDSLRWWVTEYHVDGFRLDAAAVFCRDNRGIAMKSPPILDAIVSDPILNGVKIITESWDAGDAIGNPLFLLGSKFPHAKRISQLNASFRDAVRCFWRGDAGSTRAFRSTLRGCEKLFTSVTSVSDDESHTTWSKGSCQSINFVSYHDGFSLADVVSYKRRVNEDGYDEVSFDCGGAGVTDNEAVLQKRWKVMRNMIFTLAIARGVPLLGSGDEWGFTKRGNSNAWNDAEVFAAEMTEIPWDKSGNSGNLVRFTKYMMQLRMRRRELIGADFFQNLTWVDETGSVVQECEEEALEVVDEVGVDDDITAPLESDGISEGASTVLQSKEEDEDEGDEESHIESHTSKEGFVGCVISVPDCCECMYVAFNQREEDIVTSLPCLSKYERNWTLLVDTSSSCWEKRVVIVDGTIRVPAVSCVLCVGESSA